MKKLILLTLTFIMVLLTGCDPPSFWLLKTDYLDDIESIELVKYNNSNFNKQIILTETNIITNFFKLKQLL